jgi:glycosyltransferase involved in cell wall biosynthesis
MKFFIHSRFQGLLRGGIELHAKQLTEALFQSGHGTILSSGPLHVSQIPTGTDWVVLEGVHRGDIVRLFTRGHHLTHAKTAILTHGSFYEFCHRRELTEVGAPTPSRYHPWKSLFDDMFMKALLQRFDRTITLAQMESDDLIAYYKLNRERVRVLPNSIQGPPERDESVSRDETLAHLSPYVCAVSRIDARKNFGVVLQAIRPTPVRFLLAGKPQGTALSDLLTLARRNGQTNFHYFGPISDARREVLIRQSIAVVIPSFFEGVPFAALDALRLNRPVICTRYSYLPALPGVMLVDPTPLSFRTAIENVLSHPPEVSSRALSRLETLSESFNLCLV